MWNFGDCHGYAKGSADTFKAYKDKIDLGEWVGDMIPKGATFLADRYSNETTFNGAMNNMKEAVLVFYNGKRIEHGKEASKWFFYIFYPTHLLILYLLKTFVLI